MPDRPFVSLAEASADVVARLTFRRDVAELHGKGARALAEFLAETTGDFSAEQRERFMRRLATYRAIPDGALVLTGGHRFPAVPLREVK